MVLSATQSIENAQVTFTVGQFLFLCSAVVLMGSVIGVLIKLVAWVKKPKAEQDEIITEIKEHQRKQDERMDRYDVYFERDNEAIASIKQGNIIVQQGILALLDHAINGNDVDKLKESRKNLEKYLIQRE